MPCFVAVRQVLANFKQHRSHMGIVKDVFDDGVVSSYSHA
jgi:Mg2+/Co2+ transporter CorC